MSSRSIRFIRRRISSSSVDVAEAQPEISPTTIAARRQGTGCRGMPPFDPNSRISAIAHLTTNVSDYVLWSIDNHELTRSGHSAPRFAADSHEPARAGFCADCHFGELLSWMIEPTDHALHQLAMFG